MWGIAMMKKTSNQPSSPEPSRNMNPRETARTLPPVHRRKKLQAVYDALLVLIQRVVMFCV